MRTCGILMPIFSLPSNYGIGTFGEEAYRFVDFLKKAGQSHWQILPLNPTNYGDSPYQSFSSFAGNPYFIDLDFLIKDNLLTSDEVSACDFGNNSSKVDYEKLYNQRIPLLKKAYARFIPDAGYKTFCIDNDFWLDEYALFMALKNAHNDSSWREWETGLRLHNTETLAKAKVKYADVIDFYKFVQYKFDTQWKALKKYANINGISIIGDIPIYVAYDSADVWSDSSIFLLDEDKKPKCVAGVPPDAFSDEGQLWGNPLYNWDKMEENGYLWWKRRIGYALNTYDILRIDHFRGFESYFAVPYGDKTAKKGKWIKGPGMKVFKAIKSELRESLPIIAEDLGYLTPEVIRLLKESGFPGMKVLQFAFSINEESNYLPHKYNKNCVVYTGTHDNDTIIGWTKTGNQKEVEFAKKYIRGDLSEGFNWSMMRLAMRSVADTCILMMQDFMGLSSEARINTPSTLGGNWQWRIDGGCINDWLANIIYENVELYGRLPDKN